MRKLRWLRMLGPGTIAMAALASIAATAPGPAGAGPWAPMTCRDGGPGRVALAATSGPSDLASVAAAPWFRLDPVLDRAGTLVGQRLTVGVNGARLDRVLDLPAESFAAGPFGGAVLVGFDDGVRSRMLTIDVARACASAIGETRDVIRRATVNPAGRTIIEHRVDRATRTDLGIWRRPLDGSGPEGRWLPPIDVDARFGRTWSTEFGWAMDEERVVVQSCGESACRARVAGLDGGALATIADPALGSVVGVAGDRLVAHRACPGWPCPVVATVMGTGATIVVEPDAGAAVLVGSGASVRVVVETSTMDGLRLSSVAIDGADRRDLGPLAAGQRLVGDPDPVRGRLRLPSDWVLVAPDGRLADTALRSAISIRSVLDGRIIPIDEVIR